VRRHYLQMSGGAVVSKILGGFREILLARFFGTGYVADAYRASLTLTLSPVHFLTTHAVQTCFIPLYSRYRAQSPERAAALFQCLLLLFAVVGILLGLGLYISARPLVELLLAGFDPARKSMAFVMLRIMSLGVPAYIYCALLGSLGAAQKDYFVPSVRPGLQNLGMIITIVLAALTKRPALAAYGFAGTYWVLAIGATALLLARGEIATTWHLDRRLAAELTRALWKPLRPLLLLSGLLQGNLLVERYISSLVGAGTVASMDYARFVTETTHALVLVPLGLVSLSYFADLGLAEMHRKAERVLTLLWLLLLPVSAFLAINADGLVRLLYMRGAFDATSLRMTSRALLGFSVGLWAVGGAHFLRNVLHARMQNTTVLRGEGLAVLVNIAFTLLCYRSLGILALGLGPSLAALCALLYYLRSLRLPGPRVPRTFGLLVLAMPPYLLTAWLGRGWLSGTAGLLAQFLWAGLYWGSWALANRHLRGVLERGRTS